MPSIKLSTLRAILNDLGGGKSSPKKGKKSLLSKGLKNDDILKELKSITRALGNLPHQEGSGGGSCE